MSMSEKIKALKVTGLALNLIEKIFNVNFEIKGEENIPKDKSIMFVANHFTRFETVVVPHILNKIKGLKYCRSLAYHSLFVGKFGEYLKDLKALSTSDPKRDETIISDLIKKKHNWLIYPEGQMMKDKKIFTSKPSLFKRHKFLKVSAKTGAAVLAIKAEMQNPVKGEIMICPITISCRPMHAKRNSLYSLIKKFINHEELSKRIKEEIFFESSLLSFSKILIEFGKPILVSEYIENNSKFLNLLPISREVKNEMIIESLRYNLTNQFMYQIYLKTPLSFDHFLSFAIYSLLEKNTTQISLIHLRELIFAYISETILRNQEDWDNKFRISQSINTWNIPKLIVQNEKFDILDIAIKELQLKKLADLKDGMLFFNKEALQKEWDFDEIRLGNLFKVLYNEMLYFKRIIRHNKAIFSKTLPELQVKNARLLKNLMELDFKFDSIAAGKNAKPEEIGMPFFLKGKKKYSVLLSHGYRASPMEMRDIGSALNKKGLCIYGLRLKGHGTTAEDMKTRTAEDWLYSYKIGYEILNRHGNEIFLCGFSMGGLITLINSVELENKGIIVISAPLKVLDFKFHFTSIANTVSSALEMLGKKTKDYAESKPENPDSNYNRHYFASMVELKKLMTIGEKILPKIFSKALIIQGLKDTTVDPVSGMEIYKKIKSKEKELYEPDLGLKHVIVRGEGSEKIIEKIYNFISLKASPNSKKS